MFWDKPAFQELFMHQPFGKWSVPRADIDADRGKRIAACFHGRSLFSGAGGVMKNFIRFAGISILAMSLGIVLAPRAYSFAQQTSNSFGGQFQALITQAQNFIDNASPSLAAHLATSIILFGIAGIFLIIYLLVIVPIRIHSIQKEIRTHGEQIEAMKSEIHLSSELFLDARREYQGKGAVEKAHNENVVGKSRLHMLMSSERQAQQTKHDGKHA
jgi:hypothetical protein